MKIINWKTALSGVLGGATLIAPEIQKCLSAQECNVTNLIVGASLLLLGTASKDKDVTGGTRINTGTGDGTVKNVPQP